MKKTYTILAGFAVVLALVLINALGCSRQVEQGVADAGQFKDNTGYLGGEACRACHEKEYKDWMSSHHAYSMREANEQTVRGDFNDFTFETDEIKARFFKKEGKYFVNTQGPDGAFQDFELTYTFGWEPLQQYITVFPDGHYQCLSIAWDTEEEKWFFLYPGQEIPPADWLHWSRGGQRWNSMCADCHSTDLAKNFEESDYAFHTSWSIINVSCEACHGPGEEHAAYIESGALPEGAKYNGAEHMSLTKYISTEEQVDACARCHARRSQITPFYNHTGTFLDHYIPDVLRDEIYHADGQIQEEDYVYGSFMQSKMYKHGVRCTNCHNPHSMQLIMPGNELCTQCHEKQTYDLEAHHFHPVGTESAQCVNCHMTGELYMVNDFRRDHSFRIPRPDQSIQYGTPNACNNCHTDRSAEWAAKSIEKWYGKERPAHFSNALLAGSTRAPEAIPALIELIQNQEEPAIARATAVWYLGQIGGDQASYQALIGALNDPDPIVKIEAMNMLAFLSAEEKMQLLPPFLKDPVRAVRITAANNLAGLPPELFDAVNQEAHRKALDEYETYLDMNADFPMGQITKAQYYERTQQPQKAEAAYQYAVRQDPLAHAANINLASLYNRQGRNDEALKSLQAIVQLDPEHGQAYYSLGLLYAELGQMEQAAESLEKSARLQPENPRGFYNWGLALQNMQRPAEAEKAYQEGLKQHPNQADLMYALCVLYIQQEQLGKARPLAERLNEIAPGVQEFQQLLGYVREQ